MAFVQPVDEEIRAELQKLQNKIEKLEQQIEGYKEELKKAPRSENKNIWRLLERDHEHMMVLFANQQNLRLQRMFFSGCSVSFIHRSLPLSALFLTFVLAPLHGSFLNGVQWSVRK